VELMRINGCIVTDGEKSGQLEHMQVASRCPGDQVVQQLSGADWHCLESGWNIHPSTARSKLTLLAAIQRRKREVQYTFGMC